MSPLYHGVTVRDAVHMCAAWGSQVAPGTIRSWVSQGRVHRTRDGQIDPFTLREWLDYQNERQQTRNANGTFGRLTNHGTDATLLAVPHAPLRADPSNYGG